MDWRVQLSTGVPTVWQQLRAHIQSTGIASVKPKLALQRLICGGSAPPASLMRWYLDELGVEFVQVWGMTETNPIGSSAKRIGKVPDLQKSTDASFENVRKAGLPCPGAIRSFALGEVYQVGVEVRIASLDDLHQTAAPGEAGELLVRGPWVIQEYYQVDAHDKFFNGWLITGDVAKIDEDGAIIISDRSKDVIKSGGEWISSIDMEILGRQFRVSLACWGSRLYERNAVTALPGVAMAAVVAVPHPKWDERPVVVVILEKGQSAEGLLDRIHQHLSASFAKFQLPDDALVWSEIPHTGTGKMDKKAIRAKLEAQRYARADGVTALHLSAEAGFESLVALLLQARAEISCKTDDTLMPLHLAARSGHKNVASRLCEMNAPINATTTDGLTALHFAACNGHREEDTIPGARGLDTALPWLTVMGTAGTNCHEGR
eukprot:s66_g3.t1